MSDAQENRALAHLREKVGLVTDALDTEITRAALVFTMPPAESSSIFDRLEQQWAIWNHDAPWPRVVSGLALVESHEEGWRTRTLGDAGSFDLRSLLPGDDVMDRPALGPRGVGAFTIEVRNQMELIGGHAYLVQPLPSFGFPTFSTSSTLPGPPRLNWLLIRYDLTYLADTVFPQLLERHATAEDRREFQFHVGPKGPPAAGTILVVDQFHHRPDCLMARGAGRMVLSQRLGAANARPVASEPTAGAFMSHIGEARATLANLALHAVGQCQIPPSPASPGVMQLSVRRPQGSLSDLYTGFRRRSELLSGFVMASLLAALAALVMSTERARKLAGLQSMVAAGISHELRTPLASLRVAVDDLKSGHVDTIDEARRYGEIIDAQCRRLGHVVDQALAVTRLTQSDGAPLLRAVSVPETLEAAVELLAPRIHEARVTIETRVSDDVPQILADADLALRCLINLVENALKYGGAGGWISLSARATRRSGRSVVEVSVEDRGPGIDDDEAAEVFEPFYRGQSARHSRQPGSGLGLAIVKSAVEAHGGRIELERAVPHGCVFRLCFLTADHTNQVAL